MSGSVLLADQVAGFIEQGWCVLRCAFNSWQAAAACACIWRRMERKAGVLEHDPGTWPEVYDIEEYVADPDVLACFTDRLANAVNELVGANRWIGERRWGFWPVNFSHGACQPYDIPTSGWHIDGNWFHHSVDCPRQGLLVIGLFTDIAPRGGGTILAAGSHKRTARVLARHAEGLSHRELIVEALAQPLGDFWEVTGSAGDVILAHPFLFHTRGMKHNGSPRIISNVEAPLLRPLNLKRSNPEEYSILEWSIVKALSEAPVPPRKSKLCRFSSDEPMLQPHQ